MTYVHTNIVSKNWKELAQFYINVFKCEPVYPERDLSGKWLDRLTNLKNAEIKGIHLRLPGYENGPTLEIFEYTSTNFSGITPEINRHGFGHIAFHADSVEDVLKKLLQHGGQQLGEVVIKDFGEIGVLTAVYAKDPEGNLVEIQNWQK
ncbi:glyoxalase [Clostridium formicaceticum]|uniref:Glyoxalase n=1 Tax=Clostridium formicaceticum TaxID=1497 RepID=A0ABN4THI8_9CLOT|nr:glyoxalase [Clostridium formicaceticum]